MKVGDIVKIRTGKRGNPPRGEVVELQFTHDPPTARVSRKGIGIEVYPIDCLTVVEDEGYPA